MTVREYVKVCIDRHHSHKESCDKCKNNRHDECGFYRNLCLSVLHFGKTPPDYIKDTLKQFYGETI